jgi:hypothetical protein
MKEVKALYDAAMQADQELDKAIEDMHGEGVTRWDISTGELPAIPYINKVKADKALHEASLALSRGFLA